jgi:hypothetical protein
MWVGFGYIKDSESSGQRMRFGGSFLRIRRCCVEQNRRLIVDLTKMTNLGHGRGRTAAVFGRVRELNRSALGKGLGMRAHERAFA